MISHGMCAAPVEEDDPDDPSCRGLVLAGLQLDVKEVLQSQVTLEAFTENRFLSLQRLLAFQVRPNQPPSLPPSPLPPLLPPPLLTSPLRPSRGYQPRQAP